MFDYISYFIKTLNKIEGLITLEPSDTVLVLFLVVGLTGVIMIASFLNHFRPKSFQLKSYKPT